MSAQRARSHGGAAESRGANGFRAYRAPATVLCHPWILRWPPRCGPAKLVEEVTMRLRHVMFTHVLFCILVAALAWTDPAIAKWRGKTIQT